MTLASLERVLRALNEGGVRFLVAGGVAVNAHGYQRLTHDLDLVLDLDRENVSRALEALQRLGYSPVVPVPAEAFKDAHTRERWHRERNMEVFSLTSDQERTLTVDIFVRAPFDFAEEYQRALVADLAPGLEVRFVAIETLIRMKESTGRARDLDDVVHLRWILDEGHGHE
jgi:predicted nucleotidyltransferase